MQLIADFEVTKGQLWTEIESKNWKYTNIGYKKQILFLHKNKGCWAFERDRELPPVKIQWYFFEASAPPWEGGGNCMIFWSLDDPAGSYTKGTTLSYNPI